MDRKRIILLSIIFAVAAYYGRELKIEQDMPKATPVASPLTKSTFAQNEDKPKIKQAIIVSADESLNNSIERLSNSMPNKKQLQKLGEHELHHMPASIAELSLELGNIKQLIHDNPNDGQVIGKAIAFYRTCSAQTSWPTSVRALCLANLHEVAGESLDSAPVELYRLAKLAVEMPES